MRIAQLGICISFHFEQSVLLCPTANENVFAMKCLQVYSVLSAGEQNDCTNSTSAWLMDTTHVCFVLNEPAGSHWPSTAMHAGDVMGGPEHLQN